jgi:dienelactone hydrolase
VTLRHLFCAAAWAFSASTMAAHAQQEFPPPQGSGRVVVVASGQSGPAHYTAVTQQIAQMGYDAVLFDSNPMEGTRGKGLEEAIQQAMHMPHALPGKVALVGFSLGGGISLGFGSMMPNSVAGVVVWYPATSEFRDISAFAARMKVPVLMFAGAQDSYKGCCLIGTARTLASAAQAAGKPFELVSYPDAKHDFVYGGDNYNAQDYQDALQKTAAKLKEYFASSGS